MKAVAGEQRLQGLSLDTLQTVYPDLVAEFTSEDFEEVVDLGKTSESPNIYCHYLMMYQ